MSGETELRELLPRLDALLALEIRRLRTRYQLSLDEFRGLYISDEQVDALIGPATVSGTDETVPAAEGGGEWQHLRERMALPDWALDLVLMAMAPEIEPKYATLYAYLNDDVTRRWPTIDLALRLLAGSAADRDRLRQALAPAGELISTGLLRLCGEAGEPVQLPARGFAASPILRGFLLGLPLEYAALRAEGAPPNSPGDPPPPLLADLVPLLASARERPLVLLEADPGAGRCAAARQTAAALGYGLARLDIPATPAGERALAGHLAEALLAARLRGCALYCQAGERPPDPALAALAAAAVPCFLTIPPESRWPAVLGGAATVIVRFAMPSVVARRGYWRDALAAERLAADDRAIDAAASRFRLTPGRIARAARAARLAERATGSSAAPVTTAALLAAARSQCELDLGPMASKLAPRAGWDDLVLPPGTRRQISDLADAISQRERVFGEWEFAATGGGASNIVALFAGGSGTGKTMSAGVIAREVGLDLWRINLSSVVSKYIGETEKNLERIFCGARAGDAILFFDEADALFGKRSEVKDAHDRYANIEISYLLQRIEQHDGVVILASNLSRNIDQAFTRRLHCAIEFPMPDAALREDLWRKALPGAAPVARDVDLAFLARQFGFAGGDIRAAALDAGFLAAANGGAIDMPVLVRAVARQLLKQGKVPSLTDFRPYHELLAELAPARLPR
jgi:hypothetical protein